MRRPALRLSGAAAACVVLLASSARAHLVPSGAASLVAMIAAADGMLVARSVRPTHARSPDEAATAFVARETIAGDTPDGGFVLEQRAPLLRYGELSDALLLVDKETPQGRPPRWVSVQPAGAAILLDPVNLTEDTRAVLRALWRALHPADDGEPDPSRVADALVAALAQPQRKLRALAFLDLSHLASDPAHVPPAAVERLRRYGDGPNDDPELAPAVRALGDKLAPAAGANP